MFGRIKIGWARYIGEKQKANLLSNLKKLIANIDHKPLDIDVISFSGSKYFADQVYSILSFYYNVGTPVSWLIYNDGTYTEAEIQILESIEGVQVTDVDMSHISETFAGAVKKFPTLKKIVIYSKIVPARPTILTDSDILFFKTFRTRINELKHDNWYLVDEGNGYFDKDYMSRYPVVSNPLNLGLLVFNTKPNWSIVFDYIEQKISDNTIHYWSDQTAMHIMAQQLNFKALSKSDFVTNGSDSFSFGHHFDYRKIAVRHFVGPVRHKMWQIHWSKILH